MEWMTSLVFKMMGYMYPFPKEEGLYLQLNKSYTADQENQIPTGNLYKLIHI